MKQMISISYSVQFAARFIHMIGCFGVLLSLSCFSTSGNASASNLENGKQKENAEVAAVVNGVTITIADLEPYVDGKVRQYKKKYGMDKVSDDLVNKMRQQVLDDLITTELVYQEAKRRKVEGFEDRVKNELDSLKVQTADNHDLDLIQVEKNIRRKLAIDEYLVENDLKDPEVPESEVRDFYNKGKQGFMRKESVRTRHILVSLPEDATAEEKTAARKKIEKARSLVVSGEPFDEIAKEYSDCNSASGGGELGYQERGYMPPSYDEVAFSLKVGERSDVIESEFGFHILEVLDHKSAGITPYEEMKDFISKYLNNQYARKKLLAHVNNLKQKAKIEIYL